VSGGLPAGAQPQGGRLFRDLPFDRYQQLDGLNWSILKHAVTSARHYKLALDGQHAERSDSSGLQAMHAAVLESDRFASHYRPWTATAQRRGAEYDAACAAHPLVTWLRADDYAQAQAVAQAVAEHPVAGPLCAPGGRTVLPEISLTWTEAGRAMKGRLDLLRWGVDRHAIVDLKAVPSLHPRRMAAWIARQLYHAQLAHYCAGVRALESARQLRPCPIDVYIVAYEVRPCVDVGVFSLGTYQPNPDDLDGALYCGAAVRSEALARVAAAEASGRWLGQAPEIVPVELPAWAFDSGDDDAALEVSDDD
jgi:hypothetical protein